MTPLILHAPAKVNLSLRVLGKRDDGFHEIDTLMVKIPSLADQLEFRDATEFKFSCDDPSVPSDERNLVVQALRAYEAAAGITVRYEIFLRKSIPHGAGLGGGSSDAASTLLGLNRLHNFCLSVETLHHLAASLGSDIPFFLSAGASRCTGRGEIIQAVPSPPPFKILLLKPAFSVPTPDAYGRFQHAVEIPGISYAPQMVGRVPIINDLERPVFGKHRFLAELKQWLLQRSETQAVLMSGSGSTLFAILHDGADAENLARSARHEIDPHLWHHCGQTEAEC